MQAQQVSIKLFFEEGTKLEFDPLIPVFHSWIRDGKISDQLLIDVADYRHVPDGPALMLIAHGAHYGIDGTAGGWGLLYVRKRDEPGPAQEKIVAALGHTLRACDALEKEEGLSGALRFSMSKMLVRVVSRQFAENTAESYQEFQPHVVEALGQVLPGVELRCEHTGDSRAALQVEVQLSGSVPPLAEIADRLTR